MLKSEKGKTEVKKILLNTSKKIKDEKIDFFSEDVILKKADNFFRKGIKEFSLKDYKKAINSINEAIKINKNNILYFWNQAKLYSLMKNTKEAKISYDNALKLTSLLKTKDKNYLIEKLKNGKEKFYEKKHGKPISVISDING
jgi:tetratricopeptide (TPR) repeat protein